MMDRKGRVWVTSKIRENQDPAWCNEGSRNKFAKYYPLTFSARQASFYDPKTSSSSSSTRAIARTTCSSTTTRTDGVLQRADRARSSVGSNRESTTIPTGRASERAVGWCPQVVDTNGDGKITKPWNRRRRGAIGALRTDTARRSGSECGCRCRRSRRARRCRRPTAGHDGQLHLYSVIPSPVDNSAWGAPRTIPGYIVRSTAATNPPETCITEVYKVPEPGIDPRGIDIDTNGVVWTALAASSHLASFDRRKCKVRRAGRRPTAASAPKAGRSIRPTARAQGHGHPGGLPLLQLGRSARRRGLRQEHAARDGLELRRDPRARSADARSGSKLRVPYPLGFYHRGMDGRIDEPDRGLEGPRLWANYGTHLIWHIEGGKGTQARSCTSRSGPIRSRGNFRRS